MGKYTDNYNQLTNDIAAKHAAMLANFLRSFNMNISEDGQIQLHKILYSMLYDFRTTVISERLNDGADIHIKHFHRR